MTPLPDGFDYVPELVPPDEADALVSWFGTLALQPFAYKGYHGKRRVASFGTRYDFADEDLRPAPPIPAALLPLRARVARRFAIEPAALVHALVIDYPVGAPIGWHRDRPVYADVFGVSFLSPCRFR